MKGAPWFKFFPADFLGGVAELSSEERGSYITLLCVQWQGGSLPPEHDRLERLAGGKVSDLVRSKFKACDDGRLRNDRLETHREEATERSRAATLALANRKWRPIKSQSHDQSKSNRTIDKRSIESQSPDQSEARGQRLEARVQSTEAKDQNTQTNTSAVATQAACGVSPVVKKRRKKDPSEQPQYTADFLSGYEVWPKKVNKAESFGLFQIAEKSIGAAKLIDCIKADVIRHGRDWTKEGYQYCPAMTVWLRNRRWEDVLDASGNVAFPTTNEGVHDEFAGLF